MLGMYMCRRVIYHYEDPTCASCTLKAGCAVSASAVNVDWENVHCVFISKNSYVASSIICLIIKRAH